MTDNDKALVERLLHHSELRGNVNERPHQAVLFSKAADRIEALKAENARLRENDGNAALRFIDLLRADYGSTVTILPDNEEADTKAEQMAVECCGEWTHWATVRFHGETTLQCLARAVDAKQSALEARS